MSPKIAAIFLLAAFILGKAITSARAHEPAGASVGRGTRTVFLGAYAVALLALAWPVPAAPLLPGWAQWSGVGAVVGGLLLLALCARRPASRLHYAADIAIWSGAAAASSSLAAFGSVAVALTAASAVRVSAENRMPAGWPASTFVSNVTGHSVTDGGDKK